jgi:hypothetical protein
MNNIEETEQDTDATDVSLENETVEESGLTGGEDETADTQTENDADDRVEKTVRKTATFIFAEKNSTTERVVLHKAR